MLAPQYCVTAAFELAESPEQGGDTKQFSGICAAMVMELTSWLCFGTTAGKKNIWTGTVACTRTNRKSAGLPGFVLHGPVALVAKSTVWFVMAAVFIFQELVEFATALV